MRPVSMPVGDPVATAVSPIVLIIAEDFGWTSQLLVWQDMLILATAAA